MPHSATSTSNRDNDTHMRKIDFNCWKHVKNGQCQLIYDKTYHFPHETLQRPQWSLTKGLKHG